MKILSIETSCDDTCISIFEVKGGLQNATFKMLANNSNSQIKIHMPYGGVYPKLAKREHEKNLPILLEQALRNAGILREGGLGSASARVREIFQQKNIRAESGQNTGIDLIAVTYGPGLEMCLWTGITFAQDLAKKWNVPVVPVNHMEGHVLSVFGKNKPARNASRSDSGGGKFRIPKVKLPMLALLVSGGHTQLVLSRKWMQYEIIGETLDDAVGEAFDKVARMLGLPYPGGPEISKLAEKARRHFEGLENFSGPRFPGSLPRPDHSKSSSPSRASDPEKISFSVALPRPMLHSKNFDFSFAGLKTAVLYLIKKIGPLDEKTKSKIALEFEKAAIECLVYKTKKAIEKYKIKTIIVAGGVAANKHLRNEMKKLKIKTLFPTPELATDNSLMIGIAGYLNYIKNKGKVPRLGNIKATGNLRF